MEDDAQVRSEIRSLLASAGHRPDKRYGQNFLAEPNIVRKIVDVAEVAGADVVEIGAGTGALTTSLAQSASRVVAYEIDRRLIPVLDTTVGRFANVEVRCADVTRIPLSDLLDGDSWIMVANLPYNVGTGIVLDTLRKVSKVQRCVVMVQSEVAARLLAPPGSKTYGLPSVVASLHTTGRVVMNVPKQVFIPPPRVDSTVIRLDRCRAPSQSERAIRIAAAGFGQRRKMVRRSLSEVLEDPVGTLERAGIDPTLRAEDLAPLDYVAIAVAEGER